MWRVRRVDEQKDRLTSHGARSDGPELKGLAPLLRSGRDLGAAAGGFDLGAGTGREGGGLHSEFDL